jgi:Big-like domain-containing protein
MSISYSRLFACGLSIAVAATTAAQLPAAPDGAIVNGVAQVKRGDNERGLQTLDRAVRTLGPSRAHASDVALAHLYMGVAYANMGQEGLARDRFREALRVDKGVRLDPKEFPPNVVQTFEQARGGSQNKKKLALVGGIAAAGVTAVAIAASSGGNDGAASTPAAQLPSSLNAVVGPTPTAPCIGVGNPRVTLVSPRDGDTLAGMFVLRANALDDGGVAEVRFYVDDKLIGLASAGTAELPWDTRAVANGTHQVQARALDGCQGQGFSTPVLISIRN